MSGSQWGKILSGAKTRGLQVTITPEEAWNLFLAQDGKCALTGVGLVFNAVGKGDEWYRFSTASLDRIDSDKDYVAGNCRWVHKAINLMRMTMNDAEFIEWCRLVVRRAELSGQLDKPFVPDGRKRVRGRRRNLSPPNPNAAA